LRALRGLVPLSGGTLEILGRRMDPETSFALPSDVAFIPQHLGLVRARSVLTNVLAGALARLPTWRSWTGFASPDEVEFAHQLLRRLEIDHLADQPVLSISGGERQRAAIARAWMQRPRLVLADEFMSHLDAGTAEIVLSEVDASRQLGIAYVATTHQVEMIRAHRGPLFTLREGRPAA
jgi:phosphonate transport system ATP-binding protein